MKQMDELITKIHELREANFSLRYIMRRCANLCTERMEAELKENEMLLDYYQREVLSLYTNMTK